jgi:hypothetical protein
MMRAIPYLTALSGVLLTSVVLWLDNGGSMVGHGLSPLAFHAGALLVSLGAMLFANRFFGRYRDRIWIAFVSCWLCLSALEVSLRIAGTMGCYAEQRTGRYFSPYERNQPDDQRRWKASSAHLLETPEYRYERQTNSLGFSDSEFVHKPVGKILIQSYGDSYTEGDGAPADSAYPTLLNGLLGKRGFVVQNFGTCGSDPAFSYKQLLRSGLALSPDVVIVAYNSGDYQTDFFIRGGLKRFHDGLWSSRPAPWWEFAYAYSHTFRGLCQLFLGLSPSGFLTSPSEKELRFQLIFDEWQEVFDSIATLSAEHGVKLLLVRHPIRFELEEKKYGQDFSLFDEWLETNHPEVAHVDLMPLYLESTGHVSENFNRLYWPIDGHHNSRGYLMMANAVHDALRSSFPELVSDSSGIHSD